MHRSLGAHSAARNKASQLAHLAAWPMGARLAPSHSCPPGKRAADRADRPATLAASEKNRSSPSAIARELVRLALESLPLIDVPRPGNEGNQGYG